MNITRNCFTAAKGYVSFTASYFTVERAPEPFMLVLVRKHGGAKRQPVFGGSFPQKPILIPLPKSTCGPFAIIPF
jgi:hypothetical protein